MLGKGEEHLRTDDMCSLQGHRPRSFRVRIPDLKRRKLAQREQVICLRLHGPTWFQSSLFSITLPLLWILTSLQVSFYPKSTLHPLIFVPLVGSSVITTIVTGHHHQRPQSMLLPFPPVCLQPPLFISRVNKRPSVSKEPDETNNITWPKLRHFYQRRLKHGSFNWPKIWQHILWVSLCTIRIVGNQWN